MTKECNRCGEVKPLSEYHVNRHTRDGYQHACRPCMNAQSKACRLRKIEHYRRKNREWNLRNADKVKVYRETHQAEYRAIQARWRDKNREHLREYERRRRAWATYAKMGKSVAWIQERLGIPAATTIHGGIR
jgi:hypothetical protein